MWLMLAPNGITCITKIHEISTLYGLSVFYVQVGDDAFGQHFKRVLLFYKAIHIALLFRVQKYKLLTIWTKKWIKKWEAKRWRF